MAKPLAVSNILSQPGFTLSLTSLRNSLIFLIIMWIGSSVAYAANGINIDSSNGLAIHGYDPVAYFSDSKPVEGKQEYTLDYKGNKWAFASEKNKQAFVENPEAFIPQYGGHCAYAAGKNAIANTDPFAWTIHNKKLFLNYSIGTRELWLKDKEAHIASADGYWPSLMKQVP
ncbi:YHS domain-containing (seleno)protein [Cocleimonas flava]|uniref:YHS domain-containing protein n=1 Tax=Cocleimonas flava TaxID=634765 RepID=A0A4V6NCG0_9GAMM|nr:YHS domain-containing (seleno)protein [Cocleimonas flava]TCJ87785.1 YHS domain-containing protein [Cocleimonas flava]